MSEAACLFTATCMKLLYLNRWLYWTWDANNSNESYLNKDAKLDKVEFDFCFLILLAISDPIICFSFGERNEDESDVGMTGLISGIALDNFSTLTSICENASGFTGESI